MKNKKGLLRILSSRIIIFLFLLIVSIILYTIAVFTISDISIKDPAEVPFNSDFSSLSKSELDTSLNEYGFYIVYDNNFEITHKSKDKTVNLSENDISLLPKGGPSYYSSFESYNTINGNKGIEINRFRSNREVDYSRRLIDKIIIEDNTVTYSTDSSISGYYTNREIELLSGVIDDYSVSKYIVLDTDGTYSSVILFRNVVYDDYSVSLLLFLLIGYFVIVVAGLVIYLHNQNKYLNEPLKLLENNIKSYKKGKLVECNYEGPKEFQNILENFYTLTLSLSDKNEENILLARERTNLISNISHDLKTPLSVIKGYVKAIEDGHISKEDYDRYLSIIDEKTDDLTLLINKLLEYSKLERVDFVLTKEKTDINEFVRNYLIDKYNEFSLNEFEIEIEIPEVNQYIFIDKFQITRVFNNIIDNSFKYNEKNTTIFIKVLNYNGRVHIKIGDNGIGIDKSLRDDIFSPFTLADTSRTSGKGTGLGLSIAKQIIEHHGGSIELLSLNESKISTEYLIVLNELNIN